MKLNTHSITQKTPKRKLVFETEDVQLNENLTIVILLWFQTFSL